PNPEHLATSARDPARIRMEAGFLDELDKRGDQMLSKLDQTLNSLSIMFDDEHRQQLTSTMQSFQKTMDAYTVLAQQAEP
ncbi:hypothetical protein ABTK38_22415, partial [Acinetobacter baumannii]